MSHKRFNRVNDDFNNWLKTINQFDIEYIKFAEIYIDVVYLDEVIYPQSKESNNETQSSQISMV